MAEAAGKAGKVGTTSAERRLRATGRITLVGALVNVLLTALKVAAGVLGGSSAMLADAAHSFSDLISDGVTYLSARVAAKPPDSNHPYGHGRFETVGTVVLASLLITCAFGIAVDAVTRFGQTQVPGAIALWVAGISIAAKELLYHATARVGRKHESPITIANAWHHRSDALSSIAALLGIAGARLGFPILDPIAAIIVAVMIVFAALKFARVAVHEVTEHALENEILEELSSGIRALPGVRSLHQLRARQMGPNLLVDLHIEVDGATTVSDGHEVAERVRRFIEEKKSNVTEVLVHVDPEPEGDAREAAGPFRPRDEVEADIRRVAGAAEDVSNVRVVLAHYLEGRTAVQVGIEVDPELRVREAKEVGRQLQLELEQIADIDHANVHLEFDGRRDDLPRSLAGNRGAP
ncbi:MAG: hypothetical protein DRJ42_17615 [Deltaproteobacteria bacterium]|nr:MAG: hypothetical protein DRJ42_17615 [Deltaproteobacteria bacterium]